MNNKVEFIVQRRLTIQIISTSWNKYGLLIDQFHNTKVRI